MMQLTSNLVNGILLSLFSVSSVWFSLKAFFIDQLPNIPNFTQDTSLVAAIGSFTLALLTALFRQSNTIKNIDENINKSLETTKQMVSTMKETQELQTKILKKEDEKFEVLISLLKQMSEQNGNLLGLLKKNDERLESMVAKMIITEERLVDLIKFLK